MKRKAWLTLRWRAVRAKEGLTTARLYWQPKGRVYVACIKRGKARLWFETLEALDSFLQELEAPPNAWHITTGHFAPMEGNAS